MAVAEVLDSAVSVSGRLPVDGLVSYDGQTTSLSMECLYCWSCTYNDSPICCVTNERLCQLPRLLVSFERALGMDGIPAAEFVCFSFGLVCFCKFTSSAQRAALHEAWGSLCFENPLSSSLAHYENMWSLVGAAPSLESTDK